jgi:hypothetical protein
MAKYRKKPVVVEAIQFTGTPESANEILKFANPNATWYFNQNFINISTLEGDITANNGDWIIKGVKGEFYPCKPDIFEATYEFVK